MKRYYFLLYRKHFFQRKRAEVFTSATAWESRATFLEDQRYKICLTGICMTLPGLIMTLLDEHISPYMIIGIILKVL